MKDLEDWSNSCTPSNTADFFLVVDSVFFYYEWAVSFIRESTFWTFHLNGITWIECFKVGSELASFRKFRMHIRTINFYQKVDITKLSYRRNWGVFSGNFFWSIFFIACEYYMLAYRQAKCHWFFRKSKSKNVRVAWYYYFFD